MNKIILLVGAAGAAYWLYRQSQQTVTISTISPGTTGTTGTTQQGTTEPTGTTQTTTPAGPSVIGTSNVTGHYAEVVGWMKAAAGTNALNLDQWSYYFQQVNNSPVTPDLMSAIVALAGGDRGRIISAEQFMTLLGAANGTWSGLSGYGPGGPFIPVRLIHYGGY